MTKETAQKEDIWNMGFDYFFERDMKNSLINVDARRNVLTWNKGFIAASNYCEHLLKEAKGKSDI